MIPPIRGWFRRRGHRRRPDAADDSARYRDWIQQYDRLTEADRQAILGDIDAMESPPKITVLLLVRHDNTDYLGETIESIQRQLYRRWQLLVLNVSGEARLPQNLGDDPRIELDGEAGGIKAGSVNWFLDASRGSYLVFVECGDQLAETALYCVVRAGLDYPGVGLIYSDEDRIGKDNSRESPHFKPDWSPDLLMAYNYIGGLLACRQPLVRRAGGFRSGATDCLLYDLLLRCTEDLSRDRIRHLPEILYHRRGRGPFELGEGTSTARREAVAAAATKFEPMTDVDPGAIAGTYRTRWPLRQPKPWVSVIIPTRNQHELLRACLDSLRSKTLYEGFEVVVVDNQSDDPDSLAYLDSIRDVPGVRVLSLDSPFNYSALNNLAVRESEGGILAFLNNDVEVLTGDWLEEMVSHAVRPSVGAVGAKLCYPDGTIQHGGVVLGGGARKHAVAAHLNWQLGRDAHGYFGDARVVRNLSAVTAACMVIRRELFDGVGGFDEENLEVAFNDVDLCLRLGELGYWIVWTPFAELVHHESRSRGSDSSRKNRARFSREVMYMRRRWSDRLDHDPFYSPNLDLRRADCALAFPPRRLRPWQRVEP